MKQIISSTDFANEVYKEVKQKLLKKMKESEIPPLYMEASSTSGEFIVFANSSDNSFEPFYNDIYQRISFDVVLKLKNERIKEQYSLLKHIIKALCEIRHGEKWEAIWIKIEDKYVQEKEDANLIIIGEMEIELAEQFNTFNISYTLKEK